MNEGEVMNKQKSIYVNLIVMFIITLALEIFVFNYQSVLSINNKEKLIKDITIGQGIGQLENGCFIIDNYDKAFLELKNINQDVNSLKLDFQLLDQDDYIEYDLEITDEGNKYYYATPERYIYNLIEKSKVVKIHPYGKVANIKIDFDKEKNQDVCFKINGIYINSKTPFAFSLVRVLLVYFILVAFWLYRPNSRLYDIKLNLKSKKQAIFFILLFIIQSVVMLYFIYGNEAYNEEVNFKKKYSNLYEYQDLAKSLYNNQLSLEMTPSNELRNMENPYDCEARKKEGIDFEWDKSYYDGKYYVYFGVVPVVLTYLPYYAITGQELSTTILTIVILALSEIGVFIFLNKITQKYFPNTGLLLFTILLLWLVNCSGLLSIAGYPSIYSLPVLFSLMFTYYGLYFWISAINDKKVNRIKVIIGSTCMALVAGCRPQLLLGSFFSIYIFGSYFKNNNGKLKNFISFITPYIIIAILLMIYNKLRFGSVFDLGTNYNLTTNDMTKRGFNIDRIGLGLFLNLFQLPNTIPVFPFVISNQFETNYMGITIVEETFGGLLTTNILLFLNIFIYKFKKIIPKKLYTCSLFAMLFSIIIIIVNTNMAGIVPRYKIDFAWLLFIPTIIIILSIFESNLLDKKIMNHISQLIFITIFLSFVYQFLYLFKDQFLYGLIDTSTYRYLKWYYLLQWWL